MVEVTLKLILDFEEADGLPTQMSVAELIDKVRDLTNGEFASKAWKIASFHDCHVSKIKTPAGTIYHDKFSYDLKND